MKEKINVAFREGEDGDDEDFLPQRLLVSIHRVTSTVSM